ncbi:unnamed protein product, partial [marine sediment metagenome]
MLDARKFSGLGVIVTGLEVPSLRRLAGLCCSALIGDSV